MSDMISRQKAIEEIVSREAVYADDAIDILRSMPSAQRWIPCSERLPEVGEEPYYIDPIDRNKLFESQRVLVYGVNENGYDMAVASRTYSTVSGDEWTNAYDAAEIELTQIIAWMPLPEPYREEGDE